MNIDYKILDLIIQHEFPQYLEIYNFEKKIVADQLVKSKKPSTENLNHFDTTGDSFNLYQAVLFGTLQLIIGIYEVYYLMKIGNDKSVNNEKSIDNDQMKKVIRTQWVDSLMMNNVEKKKAEEIVDRYINIW